MKKYERIDEAAQKILDLIDMGCKVTATGADIHEIEIPDDINIKDIEQQTGLKFKEKQ